MNMYDYNVTSQKLSPVCTLCPDIKLMWHILCVLLLVDLHFPGQIAWVIFRRMGHTKWRRELSKS